MAKVSYKYNINEQLNRLPRTVTIESFIAALDAHDISRSTFHRDRKIKINSDQSIPSDRLRVYAGLFGVSSDELTNSQKKIKPIKDWPTSAFAKKIGLKPAKSLKP